MRMYDIIKKKRDGLELSYEEIKFFINGYVDNSIPDYQVSALLMAIFINKMTKDETVSLTKSMLNSGEVIDLSSIDGIKVDKHSTGGVGDKTSLLLAPMVAACGLPVAKMSGRGLGHTGGTVDKLESIKGLRVALEKDEFINIVNTHKISICSQTANVAPADKKLYALRDVTATVDNISLIASSIMSKKLAAGSNAIVLDVKVGSGAFMKNLENAFELAKEMVDIGNSMGRNTVAILSDMDEPLGYAVGNALEVKEVIESLQGNAPEDLMELCLTLGSRLLVLGNIVKSIDEGRQMLKKTITSKKAYKKFIDFIKAQGGDSDCIEDLSLLPQSKYVIELKSNYDGFINKINAEEVGLAALCVGAGRETKESKIDLSAGIILNKKLNNPVKCGEILAFIHGNDVAKIEKAKKILENSYSIGEKNKNDKKLIYGIVENKAIKRL